MNVTVGSANPVKVQAVERALERVEPTVTGVAVDSGVDEQPRSVAETITGAENRAIRALESTGADLGVGLEGGVAYLEATSGWHLIMWAVVTDGERVGRGSGPMLELPKSVSRRVATGEELGPVMDELLGTENIARNEGAAGALTDGLTDRTGALREAVVCALAPFVTEYYDE